MLRRISLFTVLLSLALSSCGSGTQEQQAAGSTILSRFLSRYRMGVVFTPGLRLFEEQLVDMKELGIDTAKFWLDWSAAQPLSLYYNPQSRSVSGQQGPGFRWILCQDLLDDPGLIQEYAFPERGGSRFAGLVAWSAVDGIILPIKAEGIFTLPLLGDATTAPFFHVDETLKLRMAPEPEGWEEVRCAEGVCHGYHGVGVDAYLGQIALHGAGAARRYRGIVPLWNTENELNWTPVHVLVAGWRMGRAWFDLDFLGRLLQTLHEAVHQGAWQDAQTTMNLNIHDPFWLTRMKEWEPFMDVVGLGAYPNYLFSRPVLSPLLLEAVEQAADNTDRPLMVLETGFPSGPLERGYDEALQLAYLEQTVHGTQEKGACGYLWYRLDDPIETPPPGGLQAVEAYWGLVDRSGERKASFLAYQELLHPVSHPPLD